MARSAACSRRSASSASVSARSRSLLGLGLFREGLEAGGGRFLLDLLLHPGLHLAAALAAGSLLLGGTPGALLAPLARLLTPRPRASVGLTAPPLRLTMALL